MYVTSNDNKSSRKKKRNYEEYFIFHFRALHMKEHPDYKYRPRRKPKSVVKKENKFGFSLSPMNIQNNDGLTHMSRGLLPPLGPPLNHPLISHDDLKIPRFFPPFPYPLYPIQHKISEEYAAGGKLAADLAFQVGLINIFLIFNLKIK